MAKTKNAKIRLRFVQDDSGHWYAISANKKQEFDAWVQSFSDDDFNFAGECFDDHRIDGYPGFYTFTDLQEDKD